MSSETPVSPPPPSGAAPSSAPRPRSREGGRLALLVLVALLVVGGAFVAGRRSAGPTAPAPPTGKTEQAEGGAPDAEKGVVKFDEETLKRAELRVEPVRLRALQPRLAVTGLVEPNLGGVVKITPRVAGKITSVVVNVGDNVRAGQSLATLASTELATAQAAYRQAGARVAVAQNNLQRQRKLAGSGVFGRPKVEEARKAQVAAQGEINAAQTELNAAQNGVSEARSEKAAAQAELAASQSDVANAQSEAASSESEIIEAQGQVKALQAALAQAQSQVQVAQSKFNRYDTLLKEQLVSKQEWEQAQSDQQRAASDVDAARANIGQGQAKVQTARAHLKAAEAKVGTMRAKVDAQKSLVEQGEARIQSALARVEQDRARLETARRQAEIAAQSLAREEKVFTGGYLTSKEIVEAESGLRQAEADRRAAAEQVHLLGGTPGGGNLLAVAAPIGGRLTERSVTLGETVTPEKSLFTIVNLSSVWVQLNVYQKDLPLVRSGQAVTFASDAAPGRSFSGAVSYIGDVVDETTRTVKVRAVIQNAGNALKPQTFVRGTIAAAAPLHALAVPKDAVQDVEGKKVVYVQAEHPGEFRAKEVQTGDTIEDQTVITSGLHPGDRVVTVGAFLVKAQAMKSELTEE